jgi:hypothetical protein
LLIENKYVVVVAVLAFLIVLWLSDGVRRTCIHFWYRLGRSTAVSALDRLTRIFIHTPGADFLFQVSAGRN